MNELVFKLRNKPTNAFLSELLTSSDLDAELARLAVEERDRVYGRTVFLRGLIEFTSYCRCNCYYCGLRRSNTEACRYRLTKEQILSSCQAGYDVGLRTFVLQGGEDSFFTDSMLCDIVADMKRRFSDCAVTLSIGERTRESYSRLRDAGVDRYLLRHETACARHYSMLHPPAQTAEHRISCLNTIRALGFQTGCGFMVGSPYQTLGDIIDDLHFIADFRPHMVGIGPFIPQSQTPLGSFPVGSVELTLRLLSIIRLMLPEVLLPATTALGTLLTDGRIAGLDHGANVIMPNLSPPEVREKYAIYDNKLSDGNEAAENIVKLRKQLAEHGYLATASRGDSLVR